MMRYSVLFFALVFTAPFINFSLIAGANVPIAYIVTIAMAPLAIVASRKIPLQALGLEDMAFLGFLLICFVSYVLNRGRFPEGNGVKQIINVALTYLIYKVSLLLLFRAKPDPSLLLRRIFNFNSLLQVLALVFFFTGYFFGGVQETIIIWANNSQNFTIGAIATALPNARIFGFAPEPSFWALFVVMNLTLAFSIEKPSRLFIAVNILSLLLTFSRSGFFTLIIVLVIKFVRGSLLQKALIVTATIVGIVILLPYADPDALMAVDISFRQRIGSQLVSLSVFREHPFLGIGLSNFSLRAIELKLDYFDIFNLYLSLLVATGIAGLTAFVTALLFILKRISGSLQLTFYAIAFGWLTVGAYNLPYAWMMFGVLVYCSQQQGSHELSNGIN